MDIKQVAEQYAEYVIALRRHFHAFPEISEHEVETGKYIRNELTNMGVEWRPCGKGNGALATIRGGKPGRTILLRGDMDGLSVQEETGAEYASRNPGVMHACGHDCHTAMLLTAARILKDVQEELPGTVVLAYQPAEEVGGGAKDMIADGALSGVDGCFAIHVWADVEAGKVSVEPGPRMASVDQFRISVTGKGSHGAAPHQGIDAAVAVCGMVTSLQSVVSREIDPAQPAVLTVGIVSAGTRFNVVAEHGYIEGTTRSFCPEVREQLKTAIERVVKSTADGYRVRAELEWLTPVPPLLNDTHMACVAKRAARTVMGEDAPVPGEKTSGGEDFAYFLERVPGAIAWLGIHNEACGAVWPQHSGRFCVDESVLLKGAMLYAQTAVEFNAGE